MFSSMTRRTSDVESTTLSMSLWQWISYQKRRKKLSGLVYQQTQRKNANISRYRKIFSLLGIDDIYTTCLEIRYDDDPIIIFMLQRERTDRLARIQQKTAQLQELILQVSY